MTEHTDPTLTVVVRTTGKRPKLLDEALVSLSQQDRSPTQVVVVWHDHGQGPPPVVPPDTQLVRAEAGHRGLPLNAGLDVADGDLVAFLDDDDLALPHWVSTFTAGAREAPGRIVRAVAVDRPVRADGAGGARPAGADTIQGGRDAPFDYFTMLTRSRTPLCSIALPVAGVREHGLRFAEDLPVLEDWDFLLRAAPVLRIHDTGEITSVYRRWTDGGASLDTEGDAVWAETRAEVVRRLDRTELILPPGSASRLLALFEQEQIAKQARREAAEQGQRAKHALAEAEALQRRLEQMENSTSWRVTAPLRRLLDTTRRRT